MDARWARRLAAVSLVFVMGGLLPLSSPAATADSGTRVPSWEEHAALVERVAELEARIAALESNPPSDPANEDDNGNGDASDPDPTLGGDVQAHYGAAGDGTTDDTAALTAAVESGDDLYFPPGDYPVTRPLEVQTGQNITLDDGATVKFHGSRITPSDNDGGHGRWSSERAAIFHIANVDEVTLSGGHLADESSDRSVDTYGVAVRGSRDVTIADMSAAGFDHDGFYVYRFDPPTIPERVTLTDVAVLDVGRNGISVPTGVDIHMVRPHVVRAGHGAIHFEPNRPAEPLQGIRLVELLSEHSNSAVRMNLRALDEGGTVDVVIDDPVSVGDDDFSYTFHNGYHDLDGNVVVNNPISDQPAVHGVRIRDWLARSPRLEINKPQVLDYGVRAADGRTSSRASGFLILVRDDDLSGPMGNIHITDPTVTRASGAHRDAVDFDIGDTRRQPEPFVDLNIDVGDHSVRCTPASSCRDF